MKNQKKLIILGIGLVCVVLCVILLLTTCRKQPETLDTCVPETQATQDTQATKPALETEPTDDTTEPTESQTEPQTEPTEPIEESTSGGNSSPGGTSGFIGGTTNVPSGGDNSDTENNGGETVALTVEDPGTQSNAYTESLGNCPDEVNTVSIPAEGTIFYNIYQADGTILTIEDENAYVIYDGKTYKSQNGLVTVDFQDVAAEGPISLQVGNASAGARSYSMKFAEPVGTASNPEVLTSIDEIKVSIAAGQQDGYYFRWTAEQDGILNLAIESITPADAQCDIILTKGEATVKASESLAGVASMEVCAGDEVLIQVVAEQTDMAVEVLLQGAFADALGSQDNPIPLSGADSVVAEVGAGEMVYYSGFVYDMTMTAENASGASVVLEGMTYGADSNGVLTVAFPAAQGVDVSTPLVFSLYNGSDADAVYTLNFSYPVGHSMNPAPLSLGENTAVLTGESDDGYWFIWTAVDNGELTVAMQEETNWSYTVSNITAGVYLDTQRSDADPLVSAAVLRVSAGDEIRVNVSTYDPSDFASIPAGEVTFTAAFSADQEYALCDEPLTVGDTVVTADGDAVTSVFRFTAEQAGSYQITTDSNAAVLSYWGSDEAAMSNMTGAADYDADTNTLTLTVPEDAAGTAAYLIGITGAQECVVTVTKESVSLTDTQQRTFAGETEPEEIFKLTLGENQSLEYLDLTVESEYKLVLDEKTKFYHLDTLEGPLVYVNLGCGTEESPAPYVSMYQLLGLDGNEPVNLFWQHTDEQSGETVEEVFNTCLAAYVEHADKTNGVYPLTEDLMYMLQGIGTQLGWWDTASVNYLFDKLEGTLNQDVAWMFACCCVATQEEENTEAAAVGDDTAAEQGIAVAEETQGTVAEIAALPEEISNDLKPEGSEPEAEPEKETEPDTEPQSQQDEAETEPDC